jgi:hypothetical protein
MIEIMNCAHSVFNSPEFYPLRIDFKRRVIHFVRMSRDSYRNSVFLDFRTRYVGTRTYQLRIDDLLLASSSTSQGSKAVHYILHTTFCCSTLLSRCFELFPACFVLKEPGILTQLALALDRSSFVWKETFDLCLRLITRTYDPNHVVVIKPHEPVNSLGELLLKRDPRTTMTFLSTALRPFLLSVLKVKERRDWVRRRIHGAVEFSSSIPSLANINLHDLSDPEAIAYLWLVNRFLGASLASGPHARRVCALDGAEVAESPTNALRKISVKCGLPLDEQVLRSISTHSTIRSYSKDLSKSYDTSSRRQELSELEARWGVEADVGMKWAASRGHEEQTRN